MKKFLLVILLSSATLGGFDTFAQLKPPTILNDPDYDFEKRLRFGFSLGLNFMDFRVKSNPVDAGNADSLFVYVRTIYPGFNVNVVSDFRIFPTLHIRFLPGLAFGHRELVFLEPSGYEYSKEGRVEKIPSSYIELPLSIKYSAQRKSNTRPYLLAGANFRADMDAFKSLKPDEEIYLRLRKGDFYYELGFGLDFFLTYFKFSTEVKLSSGIFNAMAEAARDDEAEIRFNAIKHLRSQLLTVSFHFE